ncbi:hypothetical protein PR048_011609 [Dryococelus australis]|uniref:Uncharacterized protein n=1 Tax=Dryococelus australis TaxID=614101 RepID=A0ABQ9HMD4_9NEOP|nr:hypothetical protein PR048_011609 [Dryococelus australis]
MALKTPTVSKNRTFPNNNLSSTRIVPATNRAAISRQSTMRLAQKFGCCYRETRSQKNSSVVTSLLIFLQCRQLSYRIFPPDIAIPHGVEVPECRGGVNGRSPRKFADQRHRPARLPLAKFRSYPAGVEPGSPWWEASSLTAQPLRRPIRKWMYKRRAKSAVETFVSVRWSGVLES